MKATATLATLALLLAGGCSTDGADRGTCPEGYRCIPIDEGQDAAPQDSDDPGQQDTASDDDADSPRDSGPQDADATPDGEDTPDAVQRPDTDEQDSDTPPDADDPVGNGVLTGTNPYPDRLPTILDLDWEAFPTPPDSRTPIQGRRLFVATDGSDSGGNGSQERPFRSINRGLSAARAGDWVVVRGGTYAEGPAGDFIGLRLEADRSGITVAAWQGEQVVVRPSRDGINYGALIAADDVRIIGLDFEGFPYVGFLLGDDERTSSRITLADFNIRGSREGLAVAPDNGDNGPPAIDGLLVHQGSIVAETIGLHCGGGPCINVRLQGLDVRSTGGAGSGADGIAIERGRNVVVFDVEVSGAAGDGIDLKAADAAVFNVRVHDVERNGVKLWSNGDLVNSVITDTGADAAVVFDRPGRYRILNSLVAYHLWHGLDAYSVTIGYDHPDQPYEVTVANSIFYRNSGGVYITPGSQATITDCVFNDIDNQRAVEVPSQRGGQLLTIRLGDSTRLLGDHGLGSNSIPFNTPATFVSTDRRDFHLADGSALINAGHPQAPFPDFDLDGRPRTQGELPDIGPFER